MSTRADSTLSSNTGMGRTCKHKTNSPVYENLGELLPHKTDRSETTASLGAVANLESGE